MSPRPSPLDTRGFGLVHLLVAMGVILGALFVFLGKKGDAPATTSTSPASPMPDETPAAAGCSIEAEGCAAK